MNILNVFASEPYIESASFEQIAKHIYRNFPRAIKILVKIANENKCVICENLSLNYKSKASLGNHLNFIHRKRTMEYFRDNVMTLTLDELEEKIDHE